MVLTDCALLSFKVHANSRLKVSCRKSEYEYLIRLVYRQNLLLHQKFIPQM